MPNITGTPGNDHLTGGPDGDSIYGFAGDDLLSGAEGPDYLYGGDGNDTLNGDAGDDYLEGEAGNDSLFGGAGADYLFGGAGADFLSGGADADDLSGQDGNDTLQGDAGNDTLDGGAGADVLIGGEGENYVVGGEGIDTALFAGPHAAYAQGHSSGSFGVQWDITSGASVDHLAGVERLQFADVRLAIDLGGNAGFVARLIGAALGPQFLSYADYVGIGLFYLDQGAPQDALVQAVIDARLGPHASSMALVGLVYANLAGHAPAPDDAAYYATFLDSGEWTQVQLVELAMQTSFNANNIGFAGLLSSGLEFVPW